MACRPHSSLPLPCLCLCLCWCLEPCGSACLCFASEASSCRYLSGCHCSHRCPRSSSCCHCLQCLLLFACSGRQRTHRAVQQGREKTEQPASLQASGGVGTTVKAVTAYCCAACHAPVMVVVVRLLTCCPGGRACAACSAAGHDPAQNHRCCFGVCFCSCCHCCFCSCCHCCFCSCFHSNSCFHCGCCSCFRCSCFHCGCCFAACHASPEQTCVGGAGFGLHRCHLRSLSPCRARHPRARQRGQHQLSPPPHQRQPYRKHQRQRRPVCVRCALAGGQAPPCTCSGLQVLWRARA